MKLHMFGIAVIASAVALQVAPCQTTPFPQKPFGLAMKVTTAVGPVGNACELFDCLPHQTLAFLGERIGIEVYAQEGSPYVLFFGMPAVGCQQIPQLDNALAVWAPIVILEIGTIGAQHTGSDADCDAPFSTTSLIVPATIPVGTQFRMQMFGTGLAGEGLGFSRAVEVHTR